MLWSGQTIQGAEKEKPRTAARGLCVPALTALGSPWFAVIGFRLAGGQVFTG
jgi:hypothetical protein